MRIRAVQPSHRGREHGVVNQVVASIRETIGPVAAFKPAVVVDHLPRT